MNQEQKEKAIRRTLIWQRENPERVKINSRAAYQRRKAKGIKSKPITKEKRDRAVARHRAKYPWFKIMAGAKYRCNNPNAHYYHRYGGRGIRYLLSNQDISYLWRRDDAEFMDRPSIDRIDNDGDYSLSNARFIEHRDNCRQHCKSKRTRRQRKYKCLVK